jgi:two-component system chemotaxis response regulator CheB
MSTSAGGSYNEKPIRLVVIEDSPIQREALVDLFEEDQNLSVVAAVGTGKEGIEKVKQLKPDLVTCDIGLPDMDGFEVVRSVMAEQPTPIIMLTATLRPKWRKDAFHALTLGAMDVIEKPELADLNDKDWRKRIQRQLRFIARSPVIPHVLDRIKQRTDRLRAQALEKNERTPTPTAVRAPRPTPPPQQPVGPAPNIELLVVVASAGGPKAVRTLLEGLSGAFPLPVPIIVALHLGRHMGSSFASFLGQVLRAPVVELMDQGSFEPGSIYVAPGRKHIEVVGKGKVRIFDQLPDATYSPSLDYFLWSVARVYGRTALGAILTGMGADGADGLLAMRRSGALTLGQDEASSLVYGMPRVAFELGAVGVQQAPQDMPITICEWLGIRGKVRA